MGRSDRERAPGAPFGQSVTNLRGDLDSSLRLRDGVFAFSFNETHRPNLRSHRRQSIGTGGRRNVNSSSHSGRKKDAVEIVEYVELMNVPLAVYRGTPDGSPCSHSSRP